MKILKYIFFVLSAFIFLVSCEREYAAPPLTEPKYDGPVDNITLLELKKRYSDIKDPKLIEDDLIIKGIVTGNDESGNIYKQLYIQDGTAAINMGIDQNEMYAVFQVGQQVYIHLKGLYIVKYGGELQIGMGLTNANRVAWEVFNSKSYLNGWPDNKNAVSKVVTLSSLNDDLVHQLVEIQDVRFINGGKKPFTTGDATTNEPIKDKTGLTLDVRTSNYSDFAKDILPSGKGTVVGILGRFNGGWQLLLRTKADVRNFDGSAGEEEKPDVGTFFKETFGSGYYPSGNRPKINDFTDFDMKAPVKYTDESGVADIRSMSGENAAHIWLPANRDAIIKITGINSADKGEVILKYQLAANLFDAGTSANINNIQLKINGVVVDVPNKELINSAGDNGKFYTVEIPGVIQSENLVIEFVSAADKNKVGFRLDNIELLGASSDGNDPIIVPPVE